MMSNQELSLYFLVRFGLEFSFRHIFLQCTNILALLLIQIFDLPYIITKVEYYFFYRGVVFMILILMNKYFMCQTELYSLGIRESDGWTESGNQIWHYVTAEQILTISDALVYWCHQVGMSKVVICILLKW